MTRTIALALLLGCPTTQKPPAFAWSDLPRVPSPSAGSYARVPGVASDAGVAGLTQGRDYDASLAGAAAGVALRLVAQRGGLTAPELREAAWRAGWPYPIRAAQLWIGDQGEAPPEGVLTWLQVQAGTIGLVRVRGGLEDVWVGLAATPRIDLGVVPRQMPVGALFTLPAVTGAQVTMVDPMGASSEATLDAALSIEFDQVGEYLVEVRDGEGRAALFPVYVGMVPPDLELLVPTDLPVDADDAVRRTAEAIDRVRETYGLPAFEGDPILQAAARAWQVDPSVSVEEVARRAGLRPDSAWRWTCSATSVETCVDSIVWDVRARPGLLVADGLWGVVATVERGQVRLVAAVGRP